MSDQIKLHSFPSNRNEALTMLYLQNQNLSNLSPEELSQKYFDTLKKVHYTTKNNSIRDSDGYWQIKL